MSRFNTGNPLGSGSPLDLDDNAKNMDLAVNSEDPQWVDRFGRFRLPLMEQERQFVSDQERREGEFQADQSSREAVFSDFLQGSGYQDLGEYAPGIEITAHNQYVTFGGQPYLLKPSIPVPYTTSGEWTGGDFKLIGDGSLRQDLANPDMGAAMVARGVVAVDSIADLLTLTEGQRKADIRYTVKEYHAGTGVGGGEFYWSESALASGHDGGRVIDPNKSFPGDWSVPLQVAEWFEPPIEGAGVFVSVAKSATPVITVEEFGAMAGTDIDHAPVFAAIYRSNTNRSTVIFSRGVYKTSAPFTVRIGSSVEGVSRTDTTIEGLGEGVTCIKLENAGTGRTMNCRVTGIRVTNPLTFTGITADFRGASYCRFEGIQVTISGGEIDSSGRPTAWADAIGIDLTRGEGLFNGYISLIDCYVDYHRIGLLVNVNDCRIEGGFFNKNGQLGIDIQGGAVYSIQATEVSGNGTVNDPDNHGGVRFAGQGLFCSGVWNEYNIRRWSGVYSPNNWITKNGSDVFILPGRDDSNKSHYPASGFRGTKGFSLFGQPAIADTSTMGMIRNGNFAIRGPDNTPLGWGVVGGTFNTDSGEPGEFGYSGGVIFGHVSGVPKLTQRVLSPAEVAKLKGQTIRATWVLKIPVGASLTSSQNRIGLWNQTSSGFSEGSIQNLSIFPEGEVVQYTASLEIDDEIAANPSNIAVALQMVEEGSVILYGCSVTLGQASYLNFNKPVTDAGGVVYGPLDLSGELVLPTHADNDAAVASGLGPGRPYKTASGELRIVV